MTAFAAVTLVDGAWVESGTPEPDYGGVFQPSVIDPQGVARLYEGDVSLDARRGLSLSVRLPKVGGSVARVTAKVVIPLLDGLTPPNKVGEVIATAEFVIPKRADGLYRIAAHRLLQAYLADASVTAAIEQLQSVY